MDEFRLKDFYDTYVKKGGQLDKKTYKLIVQTFLKNALDAMLSGESINLGHHIGSFRVAKFERNYKRPVVNWPESNKYKQKLIEEGKPLYNKETGEGYEWTIFYTDPYYFGFNWKKERIKAINYRSILHNVHFYELKTFARTRKRLAASINELSPIIYRDVNGI